MIVGVPKEIYPGERRVALVLGAEDEGLRRLTREQQTATVMATHSTEAAAMVDIVVRMKDGRIEEVVRNAR